MAGKDWLPGPRRQSRAGSRRDEAESGLGSTSKGLAYSAPPVVERPVDEPPVDGLQTEAATLGTHTAAMAQPEPVFDSRRQLAVGTPSPVVPAKPTSPSYRRTPYRADTVIDGWDVPAMAVRGVTMRGHLHRDNGAPRQDEMLLAEDAGRVVVCVADGVSSAQHAHVGAAAVCRYAAAWLEQNRQVAWADLDVQNLLENVNYGVVATAAQTLGLAEADYATAAAFATTLVVAVIELAGDDSGALWACVVGIGDSACWVLRQGMFVPHGHDKTAADGLISHATQALPTTLGTVTRLDVSVQPGEVLLIGTDGFGDPLGNGAGAVGDLFREVLAPGPPSPIHLAHALDFSRERFDDDRTLVAVYPTGPEGR